ncbi:MAG: hypothetical protein JSS15_10925 [Proteobacteria bacterium]|nr:hypothetical protein [Pseudomonadota bacterium]
MAQSDARAADGEARGAALGHAGDGVADRLLRSAARVAELDARVAALGQCSDGVAQLADRLARSDARVAELEARVAALGAQGQGELSASAQAKALELDGRVAAVEEGLRRSDERRAAENSHAVAAADARAKELDKRVSALAAALRQSDERRAVERSLAVAAADARGKELEKRMAAVTAALWQSDERRAAERSQTAGGAAGARVRELEKRVEAVAADLCDERRAVESSRAVAADARAKAVENSQAVAAADARAKELEKRVEELATALSDQRRAAEQSEAKAAAQRQSDERRAAQSTRAADARVTALERRVTGLRQSDERQKASDSAMAAAIRGVETALNVDALLVEWRLRPSSTVDAVSQAGRNATTDVERVAVANALYEVLQHEASGKRLALSDAVGDVLLAMGGAASGDNARLACARAIYLIAFRGARPCGFLRWVEAMGASTACQKTRWYVALAVALCADLCAGAEPVVEVLAKFAREATWDALRERVAEALNALEYAKCGEKRRSDVLVVLLKMGRETEADGARGQIAKCLSRNHPLTADVLDVLWLLYACASGSAKQAVLAAALDALFEKSHPLAVTPSQLATRAVVDLLVAVASSQPVPVRQMMARLSASPDGVRELARTDVIEVVAAAGKVAADEAGRHAVCTTIANIAAHPEGVEVMSSSSVMDALLAVGTATAQDAVRELAARAMRSIWDPYRSRYVWSDVPFITEIRTMLLAMGRATGSDTVRVAVAEAILVVMRSGSGGRRVMATAAVRDGVREMAAKSLTWPVDTAELDAVPDLRPASILKNPTW